MFHIRKSSERGFADHGWLKSRHTFSFADYRDPNHMGFRSLRVINEDRIAGGTGFGEHPHRDMEIISYVVTGSLLHADSMGTKSIIKPGEVQRMSAGSGVRHSEFNGERDAETHFFQIWIIPEQEGGAPGYAQKSFESRLNNEKMVLVASGDARDGSIGIKQEVDLYISRMKTGTTVDFRSQKDRGVWLQVVSGNVAIQDTDLAVGDAIAFDGEAEIKIVAKNNSEILLFDLA